MDATTIKRPLLFSAVAAVVLAACAWYYDAMLLAMLCFLAVLWQIACILYYAVRRRRDGLRSSGIRLLLWAPALASSIVAHNYYATLTRERGDALVGALQAHRALEGRYPQSLEKLVPRDIAVIPAVALNPAKLQKFRYSSDGISFRLNYYPGFLLTSEYDSSKGKWETRD
jgi:hypothetical protein